MKYILSAQNCCWDTFCHKHTEHQIYALIIFILDQLHLQNLGMFFVQTYCILFSKKKRDQIYSLAISKWALYHWQISLTGAHHQKYQKSEKLVSQCPLENSYLNLSVTAYFYNLCLDCTRVSSRAVFLEVTERSQDGTGQDLETLKVPEPKSPGTKEVKKSRTPRPLFLDRISVIRFTTKVHK